MADKGRKWVFRAAVEDNPKYYVVQIPSIRSRMQSNSTHTAYFLFDKNYLVDSMCTCENMARSIPCAHRGTALFAIMYKQQRRVLHLTLPVLWNNARTSSFLTLHLREDGRNENLLDYIFVK